MSVVRKRANNAHSFSGACGGGGYGAGKLSPQLRRGQLETLSRRNEVNSGRVAEVIAAAGGQLRSGVEVILGDNAASPRKDVRRATGPVRGPISRLADETRLAVSIYPALFTAILGNYSYSGCYWAVKQSLHRALESSNLKLASLRLRSSTTFRRLSRSAVTSWSCVERESLSFFCLSR